MILKRLHCIFPTHKAKREIKIKIIGEDKMIEREAGRKLQVIWILSRSKRLQRSENT